MYLHDDELVKVVEASLENKIDKNIGSISYDLTVDRIILLDGSDKQVTNHELEPGETVFIASKELLTVPDDCMCFVTLRNSCIRMGLDFESPIYQPGHKTYVYVRIRNISSDSITISAGDAVVSLLFYKLDSESKKRYTGKFQNQFDYKNVNDYRSTKLPELRKAEQKLEETENVEKTIYSNVIAIMTIFIGIFSLMNLNINLMKNDLDLKYLLVYNFITLTGISMLVTLISMMSKTRKSRSLVLGCVTAGLFIVTVLLYSIKV